MLSYYMKLYVVRHGQTEYNHQGRVQGWSDIPLNQTGHQQAHTAATHFDTVIDTIFCSDLIRTQETAQYFKQKHTTTPFFIDWRLRERCFGDIENQHKDTLSIQDWEEFWLLTETVSIPNAEPLSQYNLRIQSFLDDLKTYHSDKQSILIVTHGGTINRLNTLIHPEIHTAKSYQNAEIVEFDL